MGGGVTHPGGASQGAGPVGGTTGAGHTGAGITGAGITGAGVTGAGVGGAPAGGPAGTARASRDLGQEISDFVAGLEVVGGGVDGRGITGAAAGAAVRAGDARAGLPGGAGAAGGAGTAGGRAGMAPGRRAVGVSTLVLGNTAFVAIDPTTSPGLAALDARTDGLDTQIRNAVRRAFPQIGDVYVTTHPSLVRRIARITGDIQTGSSTTRYLSEMFAIAHAMAPGATTP